VESLIRNASAPLLAAGLSPRIVVEEGSPVPAILRVIDELGCDLVIMGTHGLGGFQQLLLGAVTEKVLRRALCPVMTIPPPAGEPDRGPATFKTILCPVDFGPSAVRALDHAFALAKEADARVILLHVTESFADVPQRHGHVPNPGLPAAPDR
jgi:nucleotide-binding universal stress UspA family protein